MRCSGGGKRGWRSRTHRASQVGCVLWAPSSRALGALRRAQAPNPRERAAKDPPWVDGASDPHLLEQIGSFGNSDASKQHPRSWELTCTCAWGTACATNTRTWSVKIARTRRTSLRPADPLRHSAEDGTCAGLRLDVSTCRKALPSICSCTASVAFTPTQGGGRQKCRTRRGQDRPLIFGSSQAQWVCIHACTQPLCA